MHQHVIQLYLGNCLKEFLFAVFGSSLIGEELLRDVGKEDDWMVVKAFILASKINAVYETDVAFLGKFDIDQVSDNLQRVWL